MNIYFSDFFGCSPDDLEAYGALDISLIADLPLFIDPFLLFNSPEPEYQKLHEEMIGYIRFLKDKAAGGGLPPELAGILAVWQPWPWTWGTICQRTPYQPSYNL
jgi:hypothetical protein